MAARVYTLGTATFLTFNSAMMAMRDVLYKYDLGEQVVGGDHEVLQVLLQQHPEAERKIGPGVSHFTVDNAPAGEDGERRILTRCFFLHRVDGSVSDFSYLK